LRLPADALRQAGITPGMDAHVLVNNATGEVTVCSQPTGGSRAYRVDRYNNIRLSVGGMVATLTRQYAICVTAPGTVLAQPQ
jgi:hypothetical protein